MKTTKQLFHMECSNTPRCYFIFILSNLDFLNFDLKLVNHYFAIMQVFLRKMLGTWYGLAGT